jgi:hypothetical protein
MKFRKRKSTDEGEKERLEESGLPRPIIQKI